MWLMGMEIYSSDLQLLPSIPTPHAPHFSHSSGHNIYNICCVDYTTLFQVPLDVNENQERRQPTEIQQQEMRWQRKNVHRVKGTETRGSYRAGGCAAIKRKNTNSHWWPRDRNKASRSCKVPGSLKSWRNRCVADKDSRKACGPPGGSSQNSRRLPLKSTLSVKQSKWPLMCFQKSLC